MTNVKPGDLARIIADPDGMGLNGVQVLVVGPPSQRGVYALAADMMANKYQSLIWEIEVLQSVPNIPSFLTKRRSDVKPGERCYAPDKHLKRIDPPEDASDLWREEPIESDRRPMEELKQFVKEHS